MNEAYEGETQARLTVEEQAIYELMLRWREQLTTRVMRVIAVLGVPMAVLVFFRIRPQHPLLSVFYLFLSAFLVYVAFSHRVPHKVRVGVLLGLFALLIFLNMIYSPLIGDARLITFAFIIFAAMLLRPSYARFWSAVALFAYAAYMALFYLNPQPLAVEYISSPLYIAVHTAILVIFALSVMASLEFLFGRLVHAIGIARRNMDAVVVSRREAERLAEQHRYLAEQMEKLVELSHAMYRFRDVESFMREVPALVRDAFDLCRVEFFAVNTMLDSLRLIGSSEATVDVATTSFEPIAAISAKGKAVLMGKDVWEHTEETDEPCPHRWAIPLSVRGDAIGVVVLHFREEPDEEVRRALLLFADEVAYAIDALRMVEELERRMTQLTRLYGKTLVGNIEESMRHHVELGALPKAQVDRMIESARERRTYQLEPSETGQGEILVFPLIWRGIYLGALALLADRWTSDKVTDVGEAVRRIAMVLENTYLLLDSRRRALEEEALRTLNDRVWANLSMRSVMEASVRELGRLLSAQEVSLYIEPLALEEV